MISRVQLTTLFLAFASINVFADSPNGLAPKDGYVLPGAAAASPAYMACMASAGSNSPVCEGDTLQLSSSGGVTAILTITDVNGNAATCTATVTVTGEVPVVTVDPQNYVIDCVPVPVTLTANASGGAPFTYKWTPGGVPPVQSVSVNPNVTTVYTVTVKNEYGCIADASTTVTVINRCGPNSTRHQICHVENGVETMLCLSSAPPKLQDHLTPAGGLHGSDYCGPCTGIAKRNEEITEEVPVQKAYITVYPNPVTYNTTIEFSIPETGWAAIEIYSITGIKLVSLPAGMIKGGSVNEIELNTEGLAGGVYICKLKTETVTLYCRIMVIR